MVRPMTEQPGRDEPSDRQGSDRPASDGAGSGRPANDRPESGRAESARPESARPESARPESARPGSARPSSGQSSSDRSRPSVPGADMLSDLQRWLIRSSARTMRKEISGQVRRTFSGGQRPSTANVWDTATTEIPPDAGESPECQWCPICRAARRMRESGPGIGGQLSGAGDAVASAVQDAISALDSMLGLGGGSRASEPRTSEPRTNEPRAASGGSASRPGAEASATSDTATGAGGGQRPRFGADDVADLQEPAVERHEDEPPHGSAAGDHGPGGWKPGDRLATAQSAEPDTWAAATEPDDGAAAGGQPAAEPTGPAAAEHDVQLDGQGHEPDDRG